MNIRNTLKNFAAGFNLAVRIHKPLDLLKPNLHSGKSGLSKCNNKNLTILKHDLGLPYSYTNQGEKFFYIVPKPNLGHLRKIIEPEERKIIKIEIPLRPTVGKIVELPHNVEKEINDPLGRIIDKKAEHIVRIRRRKMRTHKRKKWEKKNRFMLARRRQSRAYDREFKFQTGLKAMIKDGENFSPEQHVQDVIAKVNWTPPITRIRGCIAPPWVIKQYLDFKEEKKRLAERLEDCKTFKQNLK